ncbi:MFS general substrate transporter [Periconia macrospinosa]|uniref:MFS general substrate transporter n=1 Tax=Periconia macrospinosa TaxID=97972 RepID=A0A2V1E5S0_9PLEO|nr:MFS general substrate transporter [Periconia macrospinosa]
MSEEEKSISQHDNGNGTDLEQVGTHSTQPLSAEITNLSEEHRKYLLEKHGTLDLDPVPSMTDADPFNWPRWRKIINLLLVGFHALMATFTSASIIPAFGEMAKDLNTTIQRVSYLTTLQIAIIGCAPFLWRPLSARYGRRPIFIVSLIGSLCFNLGCAKARSYSALAACSAFTCFFICPAAAIGSAVVVETFFKNERAKCMGVWTVMFTLGVPTAPLIFGFVSYRIGYQWTYWILAMTNGVQLLLYLFLGLETRFIRQRHVPPATLPTFKQTCLHFHRIDPTPLTALTFLSPFRLATYPCVLIPAISYSMSYLFASTLVIIEIPQLFIPKFHFNQQQLGLQFISVIVGALIGDQLGGRLSDFWMAQARARRAHAPTPTTPTRTIAPEYRLWLAYPGYLFCIIGVTVFLVRTEQAAPNKWNITPIIGVAIASVGKQMITTVLITYAVDCYPDEAAGIGVFMTFVRQIWNFLGPFWFPQMFDGVGLKGSVGIAVGLIVGVSILPTGWVHWRGGSWRRGREGRGEMERRG